MYAGPDDKIEGFGAVSSPTTGAGVQSSGSAPTNPSTSADGFRTGRSAGAAADKAKVQDSPLFGHVGDKLPATRGVTAYTFVSATGDRLRAVFLGYLDDARGANWQISRIEAKADRYEITAPLATVTIPWDKRPQDPSPVAGTGPGLSVFTMADWWALKFNQLKWGTLTNDAANGLARAKAHPPNEIGGLALAGVVSAPAAIGFGLFSVANTIRGLFGG